MVKVIGVKFKTAGKVYYFDPDKLEGASMTGNVNMSD